MWCVCYSPPGHHSVSDLCNMTIPYLFFLSLTPFLSALYLYLPGRSWGSLAAFNTALLIVPATRNSILTLGLGIAFDHVVVYHRFLGRFTVLCCLIHFYYFYDAYQDEFFVYMTGFGAMTCAVIIFITSLDYMRRNLFNVFYWSHYAFVGYLTLAYFHCSQAKPFILTGAALYVVDKILRFIWMLWPRNMLVFRNKGESIAQVRNMCPL